jgi:hypothetical protein
MAFCSSCGTPNADTAKFCSGCGQAMSSNAHAAPAPAPADLKRSTVEKIIAPSEDVVAKQHLDELWKFYVVIAISVIVCSVLLTQSQVFPDEEYFDWKAILLIEVIWYFIAVVCLKFMAINKQRPGWALGFLILNIVLFVWYLTTDDGAFSRVMMIPEVVPQVADTMLRKALISVMIVWDECLAMLIEIITIYKIFIAVKTSKIKNARNTQT